VLLVRNAILMFVRLKMFVKNVVSLPMYVNVAHFLLFYLAGFLLFSRFQAGRFLWADLQRIVFRDVVDDLFSLLIVFRE